MKLKAHTLGFFVVINAAMWAIDASSVESPTFETPERIRSQLVTLLGKVDTSFSPGAAVQASFALRDEVKESAGGGCHTCVAEAAAGCVRISVKYLKKFCASTKHKSAKEMCELAETHPHISLGFLIEEVRPIVSGYDYCVGAGKCSVTENPLEGLKPIQDENSPGLVLGSPQTAKVFSEMVEGPMIDATRTIEIAEPEMDARQLKHEIETKMGGDGGCHHDGACKCHECVAHQSSRLANDHFAAAVWFCDQHHDCPFITSVCKCINKHPDVSYGFLIGLLKPWKFASGYCVATHSCPYYHWHSMKGGDQEKLMDSEAPEQSPPDIPAEEPLNNRRQFLPPLIQ